MTVSGNTAKITYDTTPVVGASVSSFRSASSGEDIAVYVVDSARLLSEDVTSTECGLARVGRRIAAQTVSDVGSGRKVVTFSMEGMSAETRIGLAGAAGTVLLAPSSVTGSGLSGEEKAALGIGVGFAVCVLCVFLVFFCVEWRRGAGAGTPALAFASGKALVGPWCGWGFVLKVLSILLAAGAAGYYTWTMWSILSS